MVNQHSWKLPITQEFKNWANMMDESHGSLCKGGRADHSENRILSLAGFLPSMTLPCGMMMVEGDDIDLLGLLRLNTSQKCCLLKTKNWEAIVLILHWEKMGHVACFFSQPEPARFTRSDPVWEKVRSGHQSWFCPSLHNRLQCAHVMGYNK